MSTATPEILEEMTLHTLRRMNEDLPAAERVDHAWDTVIMGDGGSLDSLGIANFLVGMEEAVADRFGAEVPLTDQDLMDLFTDSSVTVRAFAVLLAQKLQA